MKNYYFTYGSEGHPFCGGWTKVVAADIDIAATIFRAVHPCKHGNALNCCSVYGEEEFRATKMYCGGNLGHFCWETITITVEVHR